LTLRLLPVRLIGAKKNYEVDVTLSGRVRPLSVVAGEISTGKTSLLEFIAYGLGASEHHNTKRYSGRCARPRLSSSSGVR
jgi:archaellum biogenesis ATPase FlaH